MQSPLRCPGNPHLSDRCLAITTLGHPGFSYNSDAKDKHFTQISMTQEVLRWLQMTTTAHFNAKVIATTHGRLGHSNLSDGY